LSKGLEEVGICWRTGANPSGALRQAQGALSCSYGMVAPVLVFSPDPRQTVRVLAVVTIR
jgi:hypothetical protein